MWTNVRQATEVATCKQSVTTSKEVSLVPADLDTSVMDSSVEVKRFNMSGRRVVIEEL